MTTEEAPEEPIGEVIRHAGCWIPGHRFEIESFGKDADGKETCRMRCKNCGWIVEGAIDEAMEKEFTALKDLETLACNLLHIHKHEDLDDK